MGWVAWSGLGLVGPGCTCSAAASIGGAASASGWSSARVRSSLGAASSGAAAWLEFGLRLARSPDPSPHPQPSPHPHPQPSPHPHPNEDCPTIVVFDKKGLEDTDIELQLLLTFWLVAILVVAIAEI